ncbi:GntR family transcriptional regulator [Saccharopolyspora oryzae]|uniref:GntR family transcriptional regulator n=1 Tax=Saccharopolyspora oryzae TaxID=2997343 RepID=A0ABT4UWT4_9PSEU|nr:GntR family transcriptional regulator [Saccharopolyspora oryzae]MDA3626028.1 GntR family transcriptional regulator [Saccharopolyspora oryzae]
MVEGASGGKSQPLREQVHETLRQRIFEGYYVPGTRLVERALAEEFTVSRLPVREALRMLRQDGLVVEKDGRGVVVAGLSEKEVRDLFDLRAALEVLACRLAAERGSREDFAELGELLEAASSQLAAGRYRTAQKINNDFHDKVTEIADNDLLRSALEPLIGRLHWLFRHAEDLEELIDEHRRLLAAIATGDPDVAARQSAEHIAKYRAQFPDLHAEVTGGNQ